MEPVDPTETNKGVGKPLGGGQLKEPISLIDIRRWAQSMQNSNPLYYDESYAAECAVSEILAPQSFTVNCNVAHGAVPAMQGCIPGTHSCLAETNGGFTGRAFAPATRFVRTGILFDYRATHTKFAGPTVFAR